MGALVREVTGREVTLSSALIDSEWAKDNKKEPIGYDVGKQVDGHKRDLVVGPPPAQRVIAQLREHSAHGADMPEDAVPDILAFATFPASHCCISGPTIPWNSSTRWSLHRRGGDLPQSRHDPASGGGSAGRTTDEWTEGRPLPHRRRGHQHPRLCLQPTSWTPQPEQPSTSRQDRLSLSPGREEKLAGGVPTSRGCSWSCSPRLEAACPGQRHGQNSHAILSAGTDGIWRGYSGLSTLIGTSVHCRTTNIQIALAWCDPTPTNWRKRCGELILRNVATTHLAIRGLRRVP